MSWTSPPGAWGAADPLFLLLIALGEQFTAGVRLKMMQHVRLPSPQRSLASEDRLLTVEEASQKLSLTKDYLYRHADHFPFTVRVSPRQLRFSLVTRP